MSISRATLILFLAIRFLPLNGQQNAQTTFNCFSILAGINATADRSVMFAHNEDDYGTRIVNWYKVDPKVHDSAEVLEINAEGGKLRQAEQTLGYLWLEMPEMESSDGYMNEFGVVIASDQCNSREDAPVLKDGGIGYWLRRIMAERAVSARHAVLIGGALVEAFGYKFSGRTYCIADPNEAWVMAVVQGKHWVAQRVPDDHLVVIPNYYTISKVNLKDTVNFLCCPDLINYAIERGWYHPMKDGEFSFRQAYGEPASLINPSNISRMWRAVSMLSLNEYTITDELPFSFLPKEKVSLSDLMAVLRDHYEGTELDLTNHYADANPHYTKNDPICSPTTQYGFVAQLRNYLPVEMGAVMWIAPFRPCIHPFVPWYLGINEIPRGYYRGTAATALEQHFNIPGDLYQENDSLAFWQFTRHMKTVDQEYGRQYKKEHGRSTSFERSLMQKQVALERDILYNYRDEPFKMREKLTMFTQEAAYDALKLIQGKYKGR